jgi:hypothetical protein
MRLRKSLATAVAALALSGTAVTSGLTSAGAVDTVANATVTVIHAIPKTPVTVYANDKVLIANFQFGKSVGPVALPPAVYKLAIRPLGAPATSTPILTKIITLVAGYNGTVLANLNAAGKPLMTVFRNPVNAPPAGDARVIVRHMAAAPGVDVYAGPTTSPALINNLLNGTGAGANVPAGSYNISVFVHGTKSAPVIGPANFTFAEGKTYIVYAIGSAISKPSTLTVATQIYGTSPTTPTTTPATNLPG